MISANVDCCLGISRMACVGNGRPDPGVPAPLLEFSVPKAWDGAVESIESRKDD